MRVSESKFTYGIIKENPNGTTLWYEPITDEVDGFVLRSSKGYILATSCDSTICIDNPSDFYKINNGRIEILYEED